MDMSPSDIERMVVVNSVTYAKLCQLYGDDMRRNRCGRMLMVSSMAGLCSAAPNTAVYGATKAFAKSLSLALAKEMEPFGVGVTCLIPGAVGSTNFRARSGMNRALCWSLPFYPRTPEAVAHQGVISVLDGDTQTIPGLQNRLFAAIVRPVIPQRFEIMCVQAAFSPLKLPSIKNLFRRPRDNDNETVGEGGSTAIDPSVPMKPNDDSSSWNPFLEPRYKSQPLPRILSLPQSEVQNKIVEDETAKSDEEEVTEEDAILCPRSDNGIMENRTKSTLEDVESVAQLEEEELRPEVESITTSDGEGEGQTRPRTLSTPSTDQTNSNDETAPKKKEVVATVEVEVTVGKEENTTSSLPSDSTQSPQAKPVQQEDDTDDTFPQSKPKNDKALDGKRTEKMPAPSIVDDNDDDPAFSPRLGPVDIMEHRKFALPKQSDTRLLQNIEMIIV